MITPIVALPTSGSTPAYWNKPSIVVADRIARALGTTMAEMFAELEGDSGTSGDR